MYAAFVAGLGFGGGLVLRQFVRPSQGVFSSRLHVLFRSVQFQCDFAAAVIWRQIGAPIVGVYGLPIRGAFGRLFWQGCIVGLVEVSALVGLIAAVGGYSFGDVALHGKELLRWGILWAVFLFLWACLKEFLFRGYTQYTLADVSVSGLQRLCFRARLGPSIWVIPGEGWVGAAGVVAIGLIFAFALRRTGNLWLCVGWHASFDFGESFLYSVPNSASSSRTPVGCILARRQWLTGGRLPRRQRLQLSDHGDSCRRHSSAFPGEENRAAQT